MVCGLPENVMVFLTQDISAVWLFNIQKSLKQTILEDNTALSVQGHIWLKGRNCLRLLLKTHLFSKQQTPTFKDYLLNRETQEEKLLGNGNGAHKKLD